MPRDVPPEPWRSFFDELDGLLGEPVDLHCFGGFALIHAYQVARTTNDIDFISLVPNGLRARLVDLAGEGSPLHQRHRIHLDAVTIAPPPESYEDRLAPLFPGVWRHLRLFVLEAHDLALTKLERNAERDRDDVQRLARAGHLDAEILQRQ
jgi:hypothetical protein